MKDKFNKIIKYLLNPSILLIIISMFVALFFIGLSLYFVITNQESNPLAYISFGLAFVFLVYFVYLIVYIIPRIKEYTYELTDKSKILNKMVKNYGFRTIVFATGLFITNMTYAMFNLVIGILNNASWYIVFAAYYFLLSFTRFFVLNMVRRYRAKTKNDNEFQIFKYKVFRNCGYLILFLDMAVIAAITMMMISNSPVEYNEIMAIATALYTFIKMGLAIYNIFKAKRIKDPVIQSFRNINMTSALVSLVSLQSILIALYSNTEGENYMFANGTGFLICIITIVIGIFMVVKGNKDIKELIDKYKVEEEKKIAD